MSRAQQGGASAVSPARAGSDRGGGIAGRYIMDWDKDSVADAGFAKIDLLAKVGNGSGYSCS